jgi:uncharacterized protein YpmB
MKKRGISNLVVVILIVLLVLVLVSIVAIIFRDSIKNLANQISLGLVMVSLNIEKVKIDRINDFVEITLYRSVGGEDFDKLRIVLKGSDCTLDVPGKLYKLETRKIKLENIYSKCGFYAKDIKAIEVAVIKINEDVEVVSSVKDKIDLISGQSPEYY